MITASIDVTLLDKSKFKTVTRKSGEKAVFCDIVLIETPNGQYGDYMVKQDSTKEEREGGLQMPIVGNAKNRSQAPAQRPPAKTPPKRPPADPELDAPDDSGMPF